MDGAGDDRSGGRDQEEKRKGTPCLICKIKRKKKKMEKDYYYFFNEELVILCMRAMKT